MVDPWKQLSKAERKLEQKSAKGLLKLEKGRLKMAREVERLDISACLARSVKRGLEKNG